MVSAPPRPSADALSGAAPPARDSRAVRDMFDAIAHSYDLLNTVLSAGRDAAWRRRAAREAQLQPGDVAVDVCTGTGKLARELRRHVGPAGRVIGVDFSEGMLEVARRRVPDVDFRVADATDLGGLAAESAHAVTIAFGLRNISDRGAALHEAHRLLRPGGRLVVLEFATVRSRLAGRLYGWYLTQLLPRAGRLVSRHGDAYRYLPRSIAAYPDAPEVSALLRSAGLQRVRVMRMSLGIVTIHVAERPGRA